MRDLPRAGSSSLAPVSQHAPAGGGAGTYSMDCWDEHSSQGRSVECEARNGVVMAVAVLLALTVAAVWTVVAILENA